MDGGLRRKDTTKGPPLRILSLDGGGVRGYSMLIIIQELMHRTYVEIEGKAPRRDQIPKPCDHFDLICGTGTGGLIAIMLGRLRLDLETCKEVYVRMTRKVFETDKTIAGIPYRSTLFKASKLEEAIKECVREHTFLEEEGNDDRDAEKISSPVTPKAYPRRHASNASVVSFSARSPSTYMSRQYPIIGGNPNAMLYDARENRTKTAVTAYYQGSAKGMAPSLLRSYDSRKEPAQESECKIWEAGRATCAIKLAFKPIQIGQSVFIDEGTGQYNPATTVLDEATLNEWPGREVGVFVSVGTGKRPANSDNNQHQWYEGFMGEYAEARRRLISKIEGCEETHKYMIKEHLPKRGVNIENYYRLNVEIGVGEFGMNEWSRLAEVSTGTRRYLAKSDVQQISLGAAAKLAKIYRARVRAGLEGSFGATHLVASDQKRLPNVPEPDPIAVELPAEDVVVSPSLGSPGMPPRASYDSGMEKLNVPVSHLSSPRSSDERLSPHSGTPPRPVSMHAAGDDRFVVNNPTPIQYRSAAGTDIIAITSPDEYPRPNQPAHSSPLVANPAQTNSSPPPRPPKTPMPDSQGPRTRRPSDKGRGALPYPVDDGPPPVVNMARKPEYHR